MRKRTVRYFVVLSAFGGAVAAAQSAGEGLEITLKLSTPGVSPAGYLTARPAAHRVSVRGLRPAAEAPAVERNPELSEDMMVVAACDRDSRELARVIVIDPRLLRAEVADEEGRLTSRRLYRPEVEFTVALPGRLGIALLRLFHPVWDGGAFELELVGEVRFGEAR